MRSVHYEVEEKNGRYWDSRNVLGEPRKRDARQFIKFLQKRSKAKFRIVKVTTIREEQP
jgi:hypothetical protein